MPFGLGQKPLGVSGKKSRQIDFSRSLSTCAKKWQSITKKMKVFSSFFSFLLNIVKTRFIRWAWRTMPSAARRALVRITQPSFTVSAAVVLFNDEGNVLLLKHILRANHGGWGIPGGFLNPGEQPAAALKRELLEEAGFELKLLHLVSVRTIGNHLEIIYRAKSDGDLTMNLKKSEIMAARWFTIDEAKQVINRAQFKQIEFARQSGENCNF